MINQALNVINEEREPIHTPGSIQPHGLLCVLSALDFRITQVSLNAAAVFGIVPEKLLDRPLADFIDRDRLAEIRACLDPASEQTNPINLAVTVEGFTRYFNGIVHRAVSGEVVLELEPIAATAKRDFTQSYRSLKDTLAKIQVTKTLPELCDLIVKEVRQLTGFDRVMVYRFNEAGDGTVIAEDKQPALEAFLGLYYPNTDIPPRAKHLYLLNWLRLLPDVNYQPSLLTGLPGTEPAKLDMSHCVLRSMSPCHIQYLQNMGVGASMCISLMQQQRLWGMITCHHNTSKYVPYEIRTICEFLGQLMSTELSVKEATQNLDYKLQLKATQVQFVNRLTNAIDFLQALEDAPDALLALTGAQGAAVCEGDAYGGKQRIALIGNTPDKEAVLDLLAWLPDRLQDDLLVTNSLPSLYPEAQAYKNVASGLLAMAISKTQHRYVLWFRPEFLQTVTWAGNPTQVAADGSVTISPRQSFAAWQETVRLKSLDWLQCEIEVAIELRSLIVDVILAQTDEMARINLELKRSNIELDSFAYIASHDLKEPLRGIHNYSNFLMEDYAEVLPEDGVAKLQTVVRLTQRMDDLISSLMHYSQLGRTELSRQVVNLNGLVQQTINTLQISQPQKAFEFRLPQTLPTLCCDRPQVSELFTNLIGNAIKYNDKAAPWVEIGLVESKLVKNGTQLAYTFYIRDNSIGIPPEHLERIFDIFKRLHPPDQYGGGTGAGLTIVRKIVERHEGKIWVESTPGEGSTFYFTLLEATTP